MRYITTGIVIFTTVAFSVSLSFADSWHIETVDSAGDVGDYCSIDLDSSQNPHISYYDWSLGDLKYARYDGDNWNIVRVDTTGDVGLYTSLSLDSSDNPHISYSDFSYGLKYAYYDGVNWHIDIVDSSGWLDDSTSIAIDSSGNPHISYYDEYNVELKYAFYDGYTWHIESVDASGYPGFSNSIDLDLSQNPHISYCDLDSIKLKYIYHDGTTWNKETIDDGFCTSIALDSYQNPHISYLWDYALKYAYYDGTIWHFETVETTTEEDFGWHTSIALDSSDNPHISHSFLNGSYYDLKYARYDGDTWIIEVVDTTGKDWTSIALDSSDYPHISYYGGPLKYAWYGPMPGITLDHFSAQAEGLAIAINWTVETTEGEEIFGFNLYRRVLPAKASSLGEDMYPRLPVDDWLKINGDLITGQNPYAYTDSDVDAGIAYEYKLEAVLADDTSSTLGTTQAFASKPTSFAILALYPNPASDYLTCLLALPSAGVVELTLYDLSGRLVLKQHLEATEPTELEAIIDVSKLASGVYTLRASSGGREVSPACGGGAVIVR